MKNEFQKWKDFDFFDIFEKSEAKTGVISPIKEKYKNNNNINYVSAGTVNNACDGYVNKEKYLLHINSDCLTMGTRGEYNGNMFYQENDFVNSNTCMILQYNKDYNIEDYKKRNIGLFIASVWNKNKKYGTYGIYPTLKSLELDKIKLPEKNGFPDFDYMYNHIIELEEKTVENLIKVKQSIINLKKTIYNLNNWRLFSIDELFIIKGSKTTPKSDLEKRGDGEYPYITTTAENQGVSGYYDYFTETGNVLTFDSAVLGTCFYQEQNFSASDHVELGIPKYRFNKKIGLFLQTIINKTNEGIYHYGHKANQKRIRETMIKLPSILNEKTNEYEPDWNYMENYIDLLEKEIFD